MNWPSYPLAKISVDIQPGFARQPKDENGSLPQLRTNNVSPDGRIDLSQIKEVPASNREVERYTLERGDILFNNTNSADLVGKTAYFDLESGKYLFSNHMTRVRVRTEVANPAFVARYLYWTWKLGGFRSMVTRWVNQAAINKTMLGSVSIPIPPPSEQRRIVEILDQADALRKKRAEADAKASRILQALFYKMFGDPVTNPMGWPREPLSSMLAKEDGALQSGPFGSNLHNSDFSSTGDVLAVGIDNVHDSGFQLGRGRRISEGKYQEIRKYTLEPGDVLLTIMGTIGRTCVFPEWAGRAICTKHVYRIQLNKDLVEPEFVSASIRFSQAVRAQLGVSTTGQIVKGLTSRELRTLLIDRPPLNEQRKFVSIKIALDAQVAMGEANRDRIEMLFTTLLHRAFTGDLNSKWREAHMKELLVEMEKQAKALEGV